MVSPINELASKGNGHRKADSAPAQVYSAQCDAVASIRKPGVFSPTVTVPAGPHSLRSPRLCGECSSRAKLNRSREASELNDAARAQKKEQDFSGSDKSVQFVRTNQDAIRASRHV